MGTNRNIECFCGSGKKQKKCHSDFHPESRAANLIRLYSELDTKVAKHYEESLFPSYCKKGCSYCCYDSFAISQIEFDLILKKISKHYSQEQIENLFNKALDYIEQIKKEDPVYYQLLESDGTKDQEALIKQVEHASNKKRTSFPCVFLEDGMCSVYDVRPYICRAFGNSHVSDDYNLNFEVCEVIPGSKTLVNESPNFDEIEDVRKNLTAILATGAKFNFQTRSYPIFYWFKVYYEKFGKRKEIIIKDDMENFSSSQRTSSINVINKFYSPTDARYIIENLDENYILNNIKR